MTESAPTTRILTAVAPDTIERVRRILAGHDLRIVTDLAGAEAALKQGGFGLVFVGARFDDSRMFDDRADTTLSREAIAGLSHSVEIFGASIFVNLNDFPDRAAGNARVRLIVDTLILPPDIVEGLAPAPLRGA
jgi:hypothetical protein